MVRVRPMFAFSWLLSVQSISAIQVQIEDTDSVKSAAKTIASGMVDYYMNQAQKIIYSNIPGYLPGPYYWWECGAMFGALIDYWKYTGDSTYNSMVSEGLQFQIGPDQDYMPPNASQYMGNDDQGFWALSAMSAAETNFDTPPTNAPSWLSLAQAVFNEQSNRWDTSTCAGGMRWQALPVLAGWNLKNSISNGVYFQLGARLARYTGNDTYAQLATRTYEWLTRIQLIDKHYNVYDNSEADVLNCTELDHSQWTYNAGTMLVGAAYMYNYTNGSALWQNRTSALLNRTAVVMFPGGIMTEICEANNVCNYDQRSFKAYLSRWMAATTQLAPFTYDKIIALMRKNAQAAVAQCTGSSTATAAGMNIGTACGLKWDLNGTWDGTDGVGQQMAALEVLLGTLISKIEPPLTVNTGGTSQSNPSAGSGNSPIQNLEHLPVATNKDRVGAGVLTGVIVLVGISAMIFMWSDAWEHRERLEMALVDARTSTGLSMSEKEKWAEKKRSVQVLNIVGEDNESIKTNPRGSYLSKKSNVQLPSASFGGNDEVAAERRSLGIRPGTARPEEFSPNQAGTSGGQTESERAKSMNISVAQSSPVAPRPESADGHRKTRT